MDRFLLAWLSCLACTVLAFEIACIISPCLSSYYYLLAKNVFGLIIGHWVFQFTQERIFKKRVNSNRKAVFITGCDSGFGFQLAKRLDSQGYHVFAGCLFPTNGGAAELKSSCSSRFCTVHIDVTQDDSVKNAKEFVEKNLENCELWAIVNNAGIFKGMDIEFTPMSNYQDSLQVNALGQVRVTKAFLSLIRKSKGRIVNVNSLAARISSPLLSSYSMSKHAAVAFTECLRRELDACGVKVISIEPEFFKTPMSDVGNLEKNLESNKSSNEEMFNSSDAVKQLKRIKRGIIFMDRITSPNTHHVIDAMEAAVSMEHPSPVYQPSGNFIRLIIRHCLLRLPDHFLDFCVKTAPFLMPLWSIFV